MLGLKLIQVSKMGHWLSPDTVIDDSLSVNTDPCFLALPHAVLVLYVGLVYPDIAFYRKQNNILDEDYMVSVNLFTLPRNI